MRHLVVISLALTLGACAWAPGAPRICQVGTLYGCTNGDYNSAPAVEAVAAAPAPEPPKVDTAPAPEAPAAPTPEPSPGPAPEAPKDHGKDHDKADHGGKPK